MSEPKTLYVLKGVQKALSIQTTPHAIVEIKTPPGVVGFQYVFNSLKALRDYAPDGEYLKMKILESEDEE